MPGGKLGLKLPHHDSLQAEIVKVFEPFTLSSVMLVQLQVAATPSVSEELPGLVVLKVYDRRFATQFRQDYNASPWSVETEQQYRQFLSSRDGEKFVARLKDEYYGMSEVVKIQNDAARLEVYLDHCLQEMFDAEVEVYNALSEIQGKCIPQLYSTVSVQDGDKYSTIQGILLQYLDGFSLVDISLHAPKDHWQSIGDDAIGIIHYLNSKDIMNEDVSRKNFLVCKDEKYQVFMIDFALCQFRKDVDDDELWWEDKSIYDEEGRVGYSLQRSLKPDFIYHRSELYNKLDEKFKS